MLIAHEVNGVVKAYAPVFISHAIAVHFKAQGWYVAENYLTGRLILTSPFMEVI